MNGYGSHTFKMVNAKDEAVYVKFHYKSDQGIKTFNRQEVFKLLTNKCLVLEWQYELLSSKGGIKNWVDWVISATRFDYTRTLKSCDPL